MILARLKIGVYAYLTVSLPPMSSGCTSTIIIASLSKDVACMRSQLLTDLAATLRLITDPIAHYDSMERRRAPRIVMPFPATVRGIDVTGKPFEVDTVLDNFSACGLYLRLARPVEQGRQLFVVVRLSLAPAHAVPAPRVALHGVVLRVKPQPDSMYGLALSFARHRFLYAVPA